MKHFWSVAFLQGVGDKILISFAAAEKAQYGHNVSVASLIINLIGNTSIFVITK